MGVTPIPKPQFGSYESYYDMSAISLTWSLDMQNDRQFNVRIVFESLPEEVYLILFPDLTLAAVTDTCLAATKMERNKLLTCGIFNVFLDKPNHPSADGKSNLYLSLHLILGDQQVDFIAHCAADATELLLTACKRFNDSHENKVWNKRWKGNETTFCFLSTEKRERHLRSSREIRD